MIDSQPVLMTPSGDNVPGTPPLICTLTTGAGIQGMTFYNPTSATINGYVGSQAPQGGTPNFQIPPNMYVGLLLPAAQAVSLSFSVPNSGGVYNPYGAQQYAYIVWTDQPVVPFAAPLEPGVDWGMQWSQYGGYIGLTHLTDASGNTCAIAELGAVFTNGQPGNGASLYLAQFDVYGIADFAQAGLVFTSAGLSNGFSWRPIRLGAGEKTFATPVDLGGEDVVTGKAYNWSTLQAFVIVENDAIAASALSRASGYIAGYAQ